MEHVKRTFEKRLKKYNQKKVFLFEQLLQYCGNQPAIAGNLIGIGNNPMDFNCPDQELVQALSEKYAGTWWEVSLDKFSDAIDRAVMPECIYLADSIQDALRLRPDKDNSYWQNALTHFDNLFANMYDIDEECI